MFVKITERMYLFEQSLFSDALTIVEVTKKCIKERLSQLAGGVICCLNLHHFLI